MIHHLYHTIIAAELSLFFRISFHKRKDCSLLQLTGSLHVLCMYMFMVEEEKEEVNEPLWNHCMQHGIVSRCQGNQGLAYTCSQWNQGATRALFFLFLPTLSTAYLSRCHTYTRVLDQTWLPPIPLHFTSSMSLWKILLTQTPTRIWPTFYVPSTLANALLFEKELPL